MHRALSVFTLALLVGCRDEKPAAVAVAAVGVDASPSVSLDATGLAPGTKVPAFRVERLDGGGSVGVPNGKVTLVVFIATWNGPAKQMLPPLQRLHVQQTGLEILAISVDDQGDGVRDFGASAGVTFALAWDKDHVVTNQLHPPSVPTTYILDRGGVVRFVHRGYHEGMEEEIARDAATLL